MIDNLYDADAWNLYDLGVTVAGDFDVQGMPTGWTIDADHVATEVPRWIKREAVLEIAARGPDVYVRGMHSKRFTALRATRMLTAMRAAETQEPSQ